MGRGSVHDGEFAQVVDQWTEVVDSAAHLIGVLVAACARVEQVLRMLTGEAAPSSSPIPARVTESWADRHRARLPKYVTSGIYVDPGGNTEVVQSGQEANGEHRAIATHLRGLGFPVGGRGRVTASEHVESKVAWRQRGSGATHVELVVNNEMCLRHEVACVSSESTHRRIG